MNMIKNVILFLKKIFHKENNIKMIEAPIQKNDRMSFINSLKINIKEKYSKKKEVETQTCVGDGLGIQAKINF